MPDEEITEQQFGASPITREEYFDERRHALNEQFQSTKTLDTSLITLSGGALVVSITFVDRIAGGDPSYEMLLLLSWIFFSVVVLGTMLSLYLSKKDA